MFSPPATMSSAFSMDEEVRLHSSNAQREKYNLLATLFGIVTALDYLERAYVRDSITAVECVRPIARVPRETAALSFPLTLCEIFARVHAAPEPVQDDAQARRRRRAQHRGVHEAVSGACSFTWCIMMADQRCYRIALDGYAGGAA